MYLTSEGKSGNAPALKLLGRSSAKRMLLTHNLRLPLLASSRILAISFAEEPESRFACRSSTLVSMKWVLLVDVLSIPVPA